LAGEHAEEEKDTETERIDTYSTSTLGNEVRGRPEAFNPYKHINKMQEKILRERQEDIARQLAPK